MTPASRAPGHTAHTPGPWLKPDADTRKRGAFIIKRERRREWDQRNGIPFPTRDEVWWHLYDDGRKVASSRFLRAVKREADVIDENRAAFASTEGGRR